MLQRGSDSRDNVEAYRLVALSFSDGPTQQTFCGGSTVRQFRLGAVFADRGRCGGHSGGNLVLAAALNTIASVPISLPCASKAARCMVFSVHEHFRASVTK